jgi:transcriptional regulator with XRE-family HTH domain
MKSGPDLRSKRLLAGIPGHMLCRRSGVSRGRLSEIEREVVQGSDSELERLATALDELIAAKQRLSLAASECGWPVSAL